MKKSFIVSCALISTSISPLCAATSVFVDVGFDRSGWESGLGNIITETFDVDIAQSETLNFAGGIESVAAGKLGLPNHLVTGQRFNGTLRPSASSSDGYLSFTWTLPEGTTSFGADFYSIAGTRQVSVQGDFGNGIESFDLRTLFGNDGGVDQGFFGIKADSAFTEITLIALGSGTNDNFTIDNVSFEQIPEPSSSVFFALGSLVLCYRRRR